MSGERHFSCGPLRFVRRPVSIAPAEGAVCFIDTGWDDGRSFGWKWRGVAVFRDGKFVNKKGKPLDREITFWSEPRGIAK